MREHHLPHAQNDKSRASEPETRLLTASQSSEPHAGPSSATVAQVPLFLATSGGVVKGCGVKTRSQFRAAIAPRVTLAALSGEARGPRLPRSVDNSCCGPTIAGVRSPGSHRAEALRPAWPRPLKLK